MVAYIKALKSFRKQIAREGQSPQQEARPTPSQGLIPSSARQTAMTQTQEQSQYRYEPAQFVKKGIARFAAQRESMKVRVDTSSNVGSAASAFGAGFSKGMSKDTENKVKPTTEKSGKGNSYVSRPYRDLPDGPKGEEMYTPKGNVGGSLIDLIDRTEGGGDYSTLFGHSQRGGGQFSGVDISNMSINEALEFASPSGEYGQWVKGKVGRVATPMGRYQIVGSTLKAAIKDLGISGDTQFSSEVQDQIAGYLAHKRISGAKSQEAKRAALRAEWEGFKHVSDQELDMAIKDFEDQWARPSKTTKKSEAS